MTSGPEGSNPRKRSIFHELSKPRVGFITNNRTHSVAFSEITAARTRGGQEGRSSPDRPEVSSIPLRSL
jgi:hypothetical protein